MTAIQIGKEREKERGKERERERESVLMSLSLGQSGPKARYVDLMLEDTYIFF